MPTKNKTMKWFHHKYLHSITVNLAWYTNGQLNKRKLWTIEVTITDAEQSSMTQFWILKVPRNIPFKETYSITIPIEIYNSVINMKLKSAQTQTATNAETPEQHSRGHHLSISKSVYFSALSLKIYNGHKWINFYSFCFAIDFRSWPRYKS